MCKCKPSTFPCHEADLMRIDIVPIFPIFFCIITAFKHTVPTCRLGSSAGASFPHTSIFPRPIRHRIQPRSRRLPSPFPPNTLEPSQLRNVRTDNLQIPPSIPSLGSSQGSGRRSIDLKFLTGRSEAMWQNIPKLTALDLLEVLMLCNEIAEAADFAILPKSMKEKLAQIEWERAYKGEVAWMG